MEKGMKVTGHDLIKLGIKTGPGFGELLADAQKLVDHGTIPWCEISEWVKTQAANRIHSQRTTIPLRDEPLPWSEAITCEPGTPDEANLLEVRQHMTSIMRNPMVQKGAIMPDACPSGSQLGTVPVGGIIASKAIHPAFHSADVHCSLYASFWDAASNDTKEIMDAIAAETHFGPGGRDELTIEPGPLAEKMDMLLSDLARTKNPFLEGLLPIAKSHLATQGDGNHFFFLGLLHGHKTLVTHHGSRGLGAQVYKRGQAAAVKHTKSVSPQTPAHQAWLDPDTEGTLYWLAIQYVAQWTQLNHELLHAMVARRLGWSLTEDVYMPPIFNGHNFVWERDDGLFYHGKGATPTWDYRAGLIPLNMGQPILIVRGSRHGQQEFCGFAPHGAGRLQSRNALLREMGLYGEEDAAKLQAEVEKQVPGLDVRFWSGVPDISETPIAYKDPNYIVDHIKRFKLVDILGMIEPLGCIMAGKGREPWLSGRPRPKR